MVWCINEDAVPLVDFEFKSNTFIKKPAVPFFSLNVKNLKWSKQSQQRKPEIIIGQEKSLVVVFFFVCNKTCK